MSGTALRWLRRGGVCLLALLGGCRFTQFPDPNVAPKGSLVDGVVMRRNLMAVHTNLEQRIMFGQITRARKEELVASYCRKQLEGINLAEIPKGQAWAYADVVRQAGDWKEAYRLLDVAVKSAKNEDRRVNDSLQMARVAAHLGKTDEAMRLVRSTFDTAAEGKAPILMATVYEVVPELEGKAPPLEVAKLVEEVIAQHEQVRVDPNTVAGRGFLGARAHHIRFAWDVALKLYTNHGSDQDAQAALERSRNGTEGSANL